MSPGVEVMVTLVLVTVRSDVNGVPLLHGAGLKWPSEPLAAEPAAFVAQRLAAAINPLSDSSSAAAQRWCSPMESLGVSADRPGSVELAYTAAVPMWWAEPEVESAIRSARRYDGTGPPIDWRALRTAPPAPGRATGAPWSREVLEHWRRRLQGEDAALLFLPRYFTMGQMRTVYQGVWGGSMDDKVSNFSRWATRAFSIPEGKAESGTHNLLVPVSDQEVAKGTQNEMASVLSAGNEDAVAKHLARSSVTTGLALNGLAGVGGISAFAMAAGASVAYQRARRARGAKPHWYTSPDKDFGNRPLHAVFEPRPDWDAPGAPR